MRRTLWFLPSFIILSAGIPWSGVASASIILSEIQIGGDKAADEFVELYNTSDTAVDLKDYSLRRKSQGDTNPKGSSLKTFNVHDIIPAHGYFLWASSAGIFKDHADTTTGGGLSDNNSLGLFDKDGGLVESLTWGTGHALPFAPTSFENPEKKESFTRDLADLSWSKTKKISPTNSKGEMWAEEVPPPPVPKEFKSIHINEVFPNPKEKGGTGEFIELYNPLSETVDLSGWEIRDASASGKYIFPSGKKIEGKGYLVVTDQDFTLSLNNTKETLSLYDAEKRIVHTVSYEKTKQGITLNLAGDKLRGGKVPTPGQENILNTDPVTKERVPKKGYRDIPVEFSAKGQDDDGNSLKYTWDFGDDHKSYKAETTHTFRETGQYIVTLTTDDGINTTTEAFELKIEKYEAPKLRIVALSPNPQGKDSELEWMEIENREKKKVDLQGFGIATGSKKKSLVNHPIRESVEIKGKSVKRLTREDALFTFHNQKGYVELRAPNSEVIASIKYKFDKSLKEGVVLKKEKGKPLTLLTTDEGSDTSKEPEPILPTVTIQEEITAPENLASTIQDGSAIPPEVKGVSVSIKEEGQEEPLPMATIEKKVPLEQAWQHFWQKVFSWLREPQLEQEPRETILE